MALHFICIFHFFRAKAKAEEMALKADAWKEYQKAAKVSIWLDAIPQITAEVAAPLSQVERVTMIWIPRSKRESWAGKNHQ